MMKDLYIFLNRTFYFTKKVGLFSILKDEFVIIILA